MKDIYAELSWRGLINQTTGDDKFASWLNEQSRTVYAGFDPTAESLHVGHMLPLMLLRRFQAAGHKPIALVGGATGMIGDPSGKSAERNLLSVEQLRANVDAIKVQMRNFLDFDEEGSGAVLVNNFDWMQSFSYLDFLRDIGKNFPVNVMMAKDSVKGRLERDDAGLSYTEFSYMLLQAYDFVHLFDKHGCQLQIGGSDQWGNITAGIDLGRRMRSAQLFGMTCPLLTKSDGTKMGKTESGAVWLSAERTSPYAFYQYWINVADEDAGKCLRFLTELDREEIESLDKSREEEPHKRQSQKRLAESLTELVHGPEGLASAERATQIFFGGEIDNLNDSQLLEIFADVPSQELNRDRLTGDSGLNIIDALVEAGLCKSKGEARRVISQGGAYVNNRRIDDTETSLGADQLASETVMVLRSGKKKYALLRFSGK
ncbi:tyrosine--tRNA ligase [Blastopirellula marina]|uniref:Tyrosine--tRNA ligase n=1 Tax=Blastopirellula marina TaxID=124 RepID=A0A2S8GB79_9BACT|nr:tyrosine--tRNA ligase [Blastopirellula marina]PQO41712.1 tyrosine--tRNA ligase [Blastopirellula marina]PTL46155.1 tyrosine--tRNA ligase [Blastopirellula marina]